jgi:hypothetical protein
MHLSFILYFQRRAGDYSHSCKKPTSVSGGALPNLFLTAGSGVKIPESPSFVQNSCPVLVLDVHGCQFQALERAEMNNLKSADKNVFVSFCRQGFQRARFHQPSRNRVG